MPCSVCFNSKTSKLDGHLSTLTDKLLFILLENTDNCSGAKKSRISAVLYKIMQCFVN